MMGNNIRLTKHFTFETGHALHGYDGKCKNLHGHSYQLFVTVIGKPIMDSTHEKNGMVIDFGDLKKIVEKHIVDVFDHAMVFNRNSPHKELADLLETQGHNIISVDYQPTSEMMVLDFAEIIKAYIPEHIKLHSIKLYETATSYAEWFASDNE